MDMDADLPVFFIGHGSPMNLVATNQFTADLKTLQKELPIPQAIVVISAHFLTRGTMITGSNRPKQIFDFYGFPKELYEIKYEPPGSSAIAKDICASVANFSIQPTPEWGIDHAATIVLQYLFPKADIPVLELSIDLHQSAEYHYRLGQELAKLRGKGILFIGSGNMIHTFQELDWNQDAKPFAWAIKFDEKQKTALVTRNHDALIHFERWKESYRAFQTPDHYFPMLTILGMQQPEESLRWVHEGIQHGSISHRSFGMG
jgi:4,5-DOPA dioxygenase extradiol